MYIQPSTSYEAVLNDGTTGLVGDLQLELLDNIGGTTEAFDTADITEIADGVYSATRTSPADLGQYTLVWALNSTGEIRGVDDLTVVGLIPVSPPSGSTYAEVTELFRILKIRTPTATQIVAAERVLVTATGEIDSEIDLASGDTLPEWGLSLVSQVCLDRAADLWRHTESVPGVLGIPDEAMPTTFGRYSWNRYAERLAPLKDQWGLA